MANVNWKGSLFEDLDPNDSFVIHNSSAYGAVYRKVVIHHVHRPDEHYMMEEATGKLFGSTKSQVKKVDVLVDINREKPSIYQ